ncbi:MAG: hypothetical protein HYR93_00510 [Chloroflexi bacterium]|nr:hypothetical protein [Chloroflexota bacterium]
MRKPIPQIPIAPDAKIVGGPRSKVSEQFAPMAATAVALQSMIRDSHTVTRAFAPRVKP